MPERTRSQYRRGWKRRPNGAAQQKWPLLNNPLRTLDATLATSLAQRQTRHWIHRRLAGLDPKEHCKGPPSSQNLRTMGLQFPAAICRLRVNAESGFPIARRGISPHPANARSCDIGFRQEPTWCRAEFPSVHFWQTAILLSEQACAVTGGDDNECEKTHQLHAKEGEPDRNKRIGLHMADVNQ